MFFMEKFPNILILIIVFLVKYRFKLNDKGTSKPVPPCGKIVGHL